MRIAATILFLLTLAVSTHADTYYYVSGNVDLYSRATSTTGDEVWDFSVQLDVGTGGSVVTVVPGTDIMGTWGGPFNFYQTLNFTYSDGNLIFTADINDAMLGTGSVQINVPVSPQNFAGAGTGIALYSCMVEPVCEDDFSVEDQSNATDAGASFLTVIQIPGPNDFPEPGTWLMLLLGVLGSASLARLGLLRQPM